MCWCFIHYWIEKCTVKQWKTNECCFCFSLRSFTFNLAISIFLFSFSSTVVQFIDDTAPFYTEEVRTSSSTSSFFSYSSCSSFFTGIRSLQFNECFLQNDCLCRFIFCFLPPSLTPIASNHFWINVILFRLCEWLALGVRRDGVAELKSPHLHCRRRIHFVRLLGWNCLDWVAIPA